MKIAVVTFCTPNILGYAGLTARINARYCRQHGYEFIHEVYDGTELHPSFEKLNVVRRHLSNADYVLWIDSDACVIDFRQKLETFCDSGHDLVVAGHDFGFDLLGYRQRFAIDGVPAGVNGGVWMLRNSAWSYAFLDEWWQRCVRGIRIPTSFLEQGHMQWMLYNDVLQMRCHTKLIVPAERFNRCDAHGRDVCGFILHAWGESEQRRIELFEPILRGERPQTTIEMPSFYVPP